MRGNWGKGERGKGVSLSNTYQEVDFSYVLVGKGQFPRESERESEWVTLPAFPRSPRSPHHLSASRIPRNDNSPVAI